VGTCAGNRDPRYFSGRGRGFVLLAPNGYVHETQHIHADVAYIPEYDDGIGAPTCVEFDLNGGAQEPVPLILDRGQWFYRCHLSSTSGGKLEIKVSNRIKIKYKPPDDFSGSQKPLHLYDCIQPH